MSLFDFTFGLSAVVLGLALTHLTTSVALLALARRRVRWAPEPLLLAAIVFLVIISVWLFAWQDRNITATTIGTVILQVLQLLLPYLAAAFVLPAPADDERRVDLLEHYDRTRALTYGALIGGLLLLWATALVQMWEAGRLTLAAAVSSSPWPFVLVYLALILIRARWFNIIVLAGGLIFYALTIASVPLKV